MKNTLLIIIFILFSQIAVAQEIPMIKWDKIIITEREAGWGDTKPTTYEITKDGTGVPFVNFNGTEKRKVDTGIIEALYTNLNTNLYDAHDPFKMFRRDSSCIENELIPLWEMYFRDLSDGDKRINDYALHRIKNYQLVKPQILEQTGDEWLEDTPVVSIEFFNKKESVKFSTTGEHAYMLPWESDKGKIYNSKISTLLGQLIPVEDSPNKELLQGFFFSLNLFDDIYRAHIDTFMVNTMFENKYSKVAKQLSADFKILYANQVETTTFDWGRDLAKNCVILDLKAPSLAKNVQHKLILGNRTGVFLYPTTSFLKEIDEINERVKSSPIYKYTIACKNCKGIIRFVNDKSFGKIVEEDFMEDLEINEIPKSKYEDRLEGAILFELKEFRDQKYSYSRWIILEDKTIILWKFSGEYLMSLGEEWTNRIFPCKEITVEELSK